MNAEAFGIGFIGADAASERLFQELKTFALTPYPVLLFGETGVGKEVCAKAVHALSNREGRPFIALNCAALPDSLAESELFGHERGAFTGASQTRPGAFELANGGTLFLDELGELSLTIQAKLLRALEAKEIRRVGGDEVKKLNVRLIAATNRDLREEVAAGRFREDLFYRLAVCEVRIPPLRHRAGDIAPLCAHFLQQITLEIGPRLLSSGALRKLISYHWPGNVRELRNVLHRAAAVTPGVEIGPDSILLQPMMVCVEQQKASKKPLRLVSKEAFVTELERNQWNRRETARVLGISRSTVKEKIKKYGLRDPHQS